MDGVEIRHGIKNHHFLWPSKAEKSFSFLPIWTPFYILKCWGSLQTVRIDQLQTLKKPKKRRWPHARRVLDLIQKSESNSPIRVRHLNLHDNPSFDSEVEEELEKGQDSELSKASYSGSMPILTPSSNDVSKLLLSRRAQRRSKIALESPVITLQESETEKSLSSLSNKELSDAKSETPSHKPEVEEKSDDKSESSSHNVEPSVEENDDQIEEAISARIEVTDISNPKNLEASKSRLNLRNDVDQVKYSIEIRNLNYVEPTVYITGSEEDLHPQSERKISNVWRKAIVKYEAKEDTLHLFFVDEYDEGNKAPSTKSSKNTVKSQKSVDGDAKSEKTSTKSTVKSQISHQSEQKSQSYATSPVNSERRTEKCHESSQHISEKHATTPVSSEHRSVKSQQSRTADNISETNYSSHEQAINDPAQKPVLIIVSKHEFNAVLMNKKRYYSETEVAVPVPPGSPELVSCRLEICVYDLEVEEQLINNLSQIERNPQVYVMWTFLGLEQRTVSMPASSAHFHTNIAYFGPLTDVVAQQIDESEIMLRLMLERTREKEPLEIGSGRLLLTPALQKPGHGFLRCVALEGSEGYATVYCSFRLLECCKTEAQSPDCLDVGIGHLQLNHCDIPPHTHAPHFYVEYSILGHCGTELETDSRPKGETVRFNHTKRIFITPENRVHLDAMLEEENPRTIRFILLSEPCNLVGGTDVQEIGHADLNLLEEMVHKNRDVISAQLPVFGDGGEELGSLSVTVIGVGTLQRYAEEMARSEADD